MKEALRDIGAAGRLARDQVGYSTEKALLRRGLIEKCASADEADVRYDPHLHLRLTAAGRRRVALLRLGHRA